MLPMPITVAACAVEGGAQWRAESKRDRLRMHRAIVGTILSTLLHVKGGYLSQAHDGLLRYTVVFSTPQVCTQKLYAACDVHAT